MDDKLNALDKLIEAVDAGMIDWGLLECDGAIDGYDASNCRDAYNGSLDAALALHEALLPGWGYCVESSWCSIQRGFDSYVVKNNGSPARAWLLAILRAYRSEVKG